MALPEDLPSEVPFSLACEGCDGGMEIEDYDQAIASGWTEISYSPDLPMANFMGLCPVCRQRQEQEELERGRSAPPPSD